LRGVARFLAFLLLLQSVALQTAAAHGTNGPPSEIAQDAGLCALEARAGGEAPAAPGADHRCIFCALVCSDEHASTLVVLPARAEFPAPDALPTTHCANGRPLARRMAGPGLLSARGPPRLS
jgi:hypothetical protein